jgi:uncharacterized protein (TIGR03435 family)
MRYSVAAILAGATLLAQQAEPSFDVVSVKDAGPQFVRVSSDRGINPAQLDFTWSGPRLRFKLPLDRILLEAFALEEWQLVAPGWLAEELYEADAIMPAGSTRQDGRLMVQTMLKQRFGLKFHREERQLPVTALIAGKGRLALQPSADTGKPSWGASSGSDRGYFKGHQVSLTQLASWLSHATGHTVIDQTGLTGVYDFDLTWTPQWDDGSPRIDRAVPGAIEQLGLRLEKKKLPCEVLVVDHIEKKPTEN